MQQGTNNKPVGQNICIFSGWTLNGPPVIVKTKSGNVRAMLTLTNKPIEDDCEDFTGARNTFLAFGAQAMQMVHDGAQGKFTKGCNISVQSIQESYISADGHIRQHYIILSYAIHSNRTVES